MSFEIKKELQATEWIDGLEYNIRASEKSNFQAVKTLITVDLRATEQKVILSQWAMKEMTELLLT